MTKEVKILYVEDDEALSYLTKDNLQLKGYEVIHALSGDKALDLFKTDTFDLCILDIMLPKLDGYGLAQYIREQNKDIPILFLSAKSQVEDRLKALRLGGDDYLTKPFSIEELVLKIEVFLKRSKSNWQPDNSIDAIGRSSFDFSNQRLISPNGEKKLTQREAELLKYFVSNPDTVLKREKILSDIWGDDDYFLGRSLDVFVSRLRKYFKEETTVKIENIHGVGFRFSINK